MEGRGRVSLIDLIKYVVVEGIVRGGPSYKSLLAGLALMAIYGLYLWIFVQHAPIFFGSEAGGLIVTGMNNSVPWGLYIAFFIFWVGVAAAGIMFGLAGYVFHHKGFKQIAVLAETQAIAAILIAMLLLLVDVGRPIRTLILMPQLPNFPQSMLDWDFIVLSTYLILNILAYIYVLKKLLAGQEPSSKFERVFIVIAAPFAIGIHTVTAFISQALVARPFWHSPLLAPRYVATAFASGPALLLLTLLIAESKMGLKVDFDVYKKTMYVIVGSLVVGLYFTLSEAQEIFWYTTEPLKRAQASILFLGKHVWWLGLLNWLWIILGVTAVLSSFIPSIRNTRKGIAILSVIVIAAVICEKTFAIVVPAFTPDSLGQVVGYVPTPIEIAITVGIHAIGLMVYAILARPALKLVIQSQTVGHT